MTFPEMIHGKKPEVAPFRPTDPLKELHALMTGEIKDWPDITRLSDLYQTYMTGAYNKAIPGFSDILAQGGKDTQAILEQAEPLIRGELPEDVKAQVLRSAAYQSLGAGTLFGPMGAALSARDLGTTSLNLMSQGAALAGEGGNAAQRWAGIAQGLMLPPSQQLYSPAWFSTFQQGQRAAEQATQQRKFNIAAAPDPVVSGITGTVMNLVGAYIGAGRGGGGNMLATSNPNTMAGPGPSDVSNPGYYVQGGGTGTESAPGMPTAAPYYSSNLPANPFGGGDINLNLGGYPAGGSYGVSTVGGGGGMYGAYTPTLDAWGFPT